MPFNVIGIFLVGLHVKMILVLSLCTRLYSTIGNIESDIVVTQFPRYASQKELDKPV